MRIKFLFKKVFGLVVTPRDFFYWKIFGVLVGNKNVIKEFIAAGMPVGKKSFIVDIPNSVKINSNYFIPFMRGLFDTDGCISFQKSYGKNSSVWQKEKRHRPIIKFTTVSKKLALSCLETLQKIGFKFREKTYTPKNPNWNTSYALVLDGKANAKRFFKVIKPKNQKHQNKFNIWLNQGFY